MKEYDSEKKDLYWKIAGLEHELKQYKSIEEELGIDLITFFQSIKGTMTEDFIKHLVEMIKKGKHYE